LSFTATEELGQGGGAERPIGPGAYLRASGSGV